jgi:hypothetical protein
VVQAAAHRQIRIMQIAMPQIDALHRQPRHALPGRHALRKSAAGVISNFGAVKAITGSLK